MPNVTSDKSWQAESDARTLTEAEAIKADAKRYKAALAKLREQCGAMMDVLEDELEEGDEPAGESDAKEQKMKPGAMGKMAAM